MRYPRVGHKRKANPRAHVGSGKPCIVCSEMTTGKVDIEVSYMRGDDDVRYCCDGCQKKYSDIIHAYNAAGY